MTPSVQPQPLDIVKTLYDAFARRDVPAVLSLFSPEIRILQSTEIPWGGEYHGHAGAGQFFGKLTAAINSTLEFERFICAGDTVVAIGWTQRRDRPDGL